MWKKLGQLFTAVFVLLILPLLPLLAEYFKTLDVKEDSITLCLSFYSFCLMTTTKSPFIFILCLGIGIIESFRYSGQNTASGLLHLFHSLDFALFAVIFVAHLIERIKRHCVKDDIFFNFITS